MKACALVIAVALAGCAGSGTTHPGNLPAGVTMLSEFPPGAGTIAMRRIDLQGLRWWSGYASPVRSVIRDPDAWGAAWAQIASRVSPAPPLPEVDFSREMVVVAAAGAKPSGGFAIQIARAARDDRGQLFFDVKSTAPGRDCVVAASITQPVDAVVVQRWDGGVGVVESEIATDCAD